MVITLIGLVLSGIGLVLTAIGILLSIWSVRYARASDRRAEERHRHASDLAEATGQTVADIARALSIASAPAAGNVLGASEARRWAIGVADVNNDGRDELLVASPWGPHSSMLHVFGQRDEWPDSFGKLTELGSGTPAGFTVGDLDADGRVEIATVQPHADEPHATGVRDEVLYRWHGEEFAEVATEPLPWPGDSGFDAEVLPYRWLSGTSVLTVVKP